MEESLNLELILKLVGKKYMIVFKCLLLLSPKNISLRFGIFRIFRNWRWSTRGGCCMIHLGKLKGWG